jgi:hypothetical protein
MKKWSGRKDGLDEGIRRTEGWSGQRNGANGEMEVDGAWNGRG